MNRMLQEARLCAAISNPHIIRYNNSWIEVTELHPELQEISTTNTNEYSSANRSVELNSPFIEFDHSENSCSDFESDGECSEVQEIKEKNTPTVELQY